MLYAAQPVAFVPSTDLGRSRRFYADVLGLRVVHEDAFGVVLESGSMSIRISNVGTQLHVQPFTVLGWEVGDVHSEIAHLAGRGVEFLRVPGLDQDGDGVWTAPDGSQVAWFKDPDGNTLSLSRH